MADKRLIVALDVSTFEEMKEMVESLGDSVSFYKVGMELFYAVGAKAIEYLKKQNKDVFLDLKLHDIPNTVAHGIGSLLSLGVNMFTIHGQGGQIMMEQTVNYAKEKVKELGIEPPKILAITVLTSFDDETWQATGGQLPIADRVVQLAKLAKKSGVDGVVASPLEASIIRQVCGEDFLVVTPGVRPSFAVTNDQKRIATPAKALMDGASHLVIGRPITKAKNPIEAANKIVDEMKTVS